MLLITHIQSPIHKNIPVNGLSCAEVPLRKYSLTPYLLNLPASVLVVTENKKLLTTFEHDRTRLHVERILL